jgi:heterodisulfide reductase subunit C
VKAMNTQDSVTMINLLSQTTREQVVSKVGELGGFTSLFKYTKGMKMEMTIAGVDSTSEKFTKIYTNQRIIKDTSVLMNLDSMYFSAVNEEGSWKLLNLNARPDEKKLNP